MQLELISWRDKAEVFCHQLAFDFFFPGENANPVRAGSCPAQVMLWVSAGGTGRHCGTIHCYSKGWTSVICDPCKLKMDLPLTSYGCGGENFVLYPHPNPLVMLCCLLTFCQRTPQSDSALLADSFW